MLKSEIRKLISRRKQLYTEQQLRELSMVSVRHLLEDRRVQAASTVLAYYSMKGEVDTHGLVERLYAGGKTVLLPRVRDDRDMDLVVYTGIGGLKPSGSFQILEPEGVPFTDFGEIEVAVIPGIAFSPDGRRMGRGKGYYDRLLPQLPNALKIGLCFPFQVLDDIPVEDHDVVMDEVIR